MSVCARPPALRPLSLLAAVLVGLARAHAQTVSLAPVFVTATRTSEAVDYVPFSHVTLPGDALRAAPTATVDGALRAIPGFSLFRRSDSLVANPTTQGVSLRGLGPSGASRSLILLDGVPLNDPFGGWVLWSKVPRESLAGIELVPGGGATAWGNAALGGVIQLFTDPVVGSRERLASRIGSFNTREIEAQATAPLGPGTFQLLGRFLATDGYYTVARENRGPLDQPASSRARWLTARWRQPLGPSLTATFTARRFAEDRGNGTPYQRNADDESFASLALAAQASPSFQWNATAYVQAQDFSSTFSSVNATRTAETPASNQFSVPATTVGASWVGAWSPGAATADGSPSPSAARTSFGADLRDVRGETREDSAYVNGAFTRRRFAGGRQTIGGIFLVHSRPLFSAARGSLGIRLDDWQETDGHRRDFLNGAPAADTRYADRDGVAFSPSAGLVWPVAAGVQLHASAQQAFRRPTLNELYRPFRVGNVITDSNPALRTEKVTSGELGALFVVGRGLPTPSSPRRRDLPPAREISRPLTLGVTGFWNELHDSVANVTIARGPVTLPDLGVIPAGGEARRKLNLDRTRVRGVNLTADWKLAPSLAFNAQYQFDDATVTHAAIAPQLDGLRLAQVPRHSASAGLTWTSPASRWSFAPRLRWIGAQFEDDLNALRLAPATVLDAALTCKFHAGAEVFLTAENIFDHRIETGRSADGLVNTGTPRLILVGVRWGR